MERLKFLEVINVLYIIIYIDNVIVFELFRIKGYEIYLFKIFIFIGISLFVWYDVIEFLGLVICKYVWLYVGLKELYFICWGCIYEVKRKDGFFVDYVIVRWVVYIVNRGYCFIIFCNVIVYV